MFSLFKGFRGTLMLAAYTWPAWLEISKTTQIYTIQQTLRLWRKWVCSLWALRCSPLWNCDTPGQLQIWRHTLWTARLTSVTVGPRIQVFCWTHSRQVECTDLLPSLAGLEQMVQKTSSPTSYINSSAKGGQRAMPAHNAATLVSICYSLKPPLDEPSGFAETKDELSNSSKS